MQFRRGVEQPVAAVESRPTKAIWPNVAQYT